jgi:hypothetical protein
VATAQKAAVFRITGFFAGIWILGLPSRK